uniref:ODAD1 central coiled coil region domain-containing protein n=1 Tax=Glossina brevipalpis TaxID=37001 RepID=A0A1A9WCT6_9MUSC
MNNHTDLDQLADAELQRLQRQLRSLQLELRNLLENKTKQLKKQNQIITVLYREHQALRCEINTLERGAHAKRDLMKEHYLINLQQEFVGIQRQSQTERTSLWELEGHIKKTEKEVDLLRKLEVPDSCYKDTIHKVQKSVVKLENRLDVVNKKCSDVLTENSKLRHSIDHMLQDRANFNEMWQSMVTQFNDGKKYIMELIDQSTLAYDQREELYNKLQVLKDRNENDKIMHIQEMREMQRRLEHDAKLQKFYDIKCKKRLKPEMEHREMDKKLAKKEAFEKQLNEYSGIIDKMKKLYEEPNTSRLMAQFKRQEDENFALFNYVNELSHEVEVLNDVTQELSDEIEPLPMIKYIIYIKRGGLKLGEQKSSLNFIPNERAAGRGILFRIQKRQQIELLEKEIKQKTEAMDYLTEGLQNAEISNNEAKLKLDSLDTRLQLLLDGIGDIFKELSGEDAPILNVLSFSTLLTAHNVKLFIGIIERRTNMCISNINIEEDLSNKILAKKDRIPKFNVKDNVKQKY